MFSESGYISKKPLKFQKSLWMEVFHCPECGNNKGDSNKHEKVLERTYICGKCGWKGGIKDILLSPEEFKVHKRTKIIDKMLNDKNDKNDI